MSEPLADGPVLLCFDGSEGATAAIRTAGRLLGARAALVVVVREPIELWEPYDPATILEAGIARLSSKLLEVDEIADEVAMEQLAHGVKLARAAGFEAEGRLAHGKAWRTICQLGQELNASVIVLGARGLSRVRSILLGGVSGAVSVHAERPVLVVH